MMAAPAWPGQACTLSCQGGSVDCDLGMLEHYSLYLKEMLIADQTCPCHKSVISLPDFMVEPVILAVNLLAGAAGNMVTLDYEGLLAASDVLTVLGIPFNIDIEVCVSVLFILNIVQHPKTLPLTRHLWWRRDSPSRLTVHGLIHYSTAYYMSFSDDSDSIK
jgi:hypothetical protein